MKPATILGVVVFALVALMHALRLFLQTEVTESEARKLQQRLEKHKYIKKI